MHQPAPDHYATLGLPRDCTDVEIRTAYRLLAKKYHPDVNDGAPEAVSRSQTLNAAHEVLRDPARRRAYDEELDAAHSGEPGPSARPRGEQNISHEVHLRIEDFLRGTTLDVRVNDPANRGQSETYRLVVPPGTAPGAGFRLPRASPFAGAFVLIRLRVLSASRFRVRGSDLRFDLRITAQRAALGGSELITGPTGTALRVSIPRGVARGETVRIPGEGLPKRRGGRGDLLVRITYRPQVLATRKAHHSD